MTDNQTLPVSQEARVEQRHRDLAGELWGDCGFVEPEPHDGTIAAVLETIAITFARFEQQIVTRERNAILEEAVVARLIQAARAALPFVVGEEEADELEEAVMRADRKIIDPLGMRYDCEAGLTDSPAPDQP